MTDNAREGTTRRGLAREVVCEGIGVHSGTRARLTLRPASVGSGRTFVRAGTRIPATLAHVADARLATTLGHDGVRAAMVEHLLAALVIAGVDDVDLLLDGDEVPILDGSARGWLACLAKAEPRDADVGGTSPGPPTGVRGPVGHVQTGALREGAASPLPSQPTHAPLRRAEAFTLDRVIRVETRGGWAEASAADRLSLDVSVNFPHPAIGAQRWAGGAGDFAAELAGARTFGFLADAEALRAAGLARGASHENALVFDAEGPMTALRWPDEPVRHKALDLLGDLALLGAPLRAHVRVHHGGHALHHALVRAITEACPQAYDDHRRA